MSIKSDGRAKKGNIYQIIFIIFDNKITKMNIKVLPISDLKVQEDNPRNIRQDKLKKLQQSIKEFPEMLNLRPLVIDENNVILGGNMRYHASIGLGLTELPTVQAIDLTEEQKKEFIIKDNLSFGMWDWDKLGNEWDEVKLSDWGMDVWQPELELEEEEEATKEKKEKPYGTDDNYSTFELIMLIENKRKLQSVLNDVKTSENIEKQEDALMHIILNYK